jgi:hypothetical protein
MDRITSFHQSGERYTSLRIVRAVFTLIGAVLLAIGGLLLVFGLYTILAGTTGEPPPGAGPFADRQVRAVSLVAVLGGILSRYPMLTCFDSFGFLLSGLQFVALGALIRLLIHLEQTARASAQSLDKIRMRLESRGEGVEPLFRT